MAKTGHRLEQAWDSKGCQHEDPKGLIGPQDPKAVPTGPTHLPAAAAMVLPADDGEGRLARGAEATSLVWHPFGGVCHKESQAISHTMAEGST